MRLAIFDLDNTLLAGDSDHSWGEFLAQKGIVDSHTYQQANDRFYQQYSDGNLDIFEFLEFALKPLAQNSKADLEQWHQQFMQDVITPIMLPKAQDLLEQHRNNGDYLLIITATNLFVTKPIAQALGVNHILATNPQIHNGQYTGKVDGIPCFQEGKVERLKQWLRENNFSLADSYFYSDSHNDLPLLELVDNPVAVDADEKLTHIALEQGWPVISLRD